MSYISRIQSIIQNKLAPSPSGSTVGAGGFAKSASSSGNFSTTSTTYVDVTNLTVTITTTGRQVFIGLIGDTGFPAVQVDANDSAFFGFHNGTSVVSEVALGNNLATGNSLPIPCSSVWTILQLSAGTYTLKLQAHVSNGNTVQVRNAFLIAYER